MFTPIVVTGRYLNADGSAASGTFSATPQSVLLNGGIEQPAAPVSGQLDSSGRLVATSGEALVLNATDDSGTSPIGASYVFALKLDGVGTMEFESPLPHAPSSSFDAVDSEAVSTVLSPTVTLGNIVVAPEMVGVAVSGANLPAGTTILSVSTALNTITLSANANATGTFTLTFASGVISLSALAANAL
jgi:hypothetical protein